MAAPNSLQIIPSGMAIKTAMSQPSMACGPPIADINRGMVMNGPIPIMFDMFSAVAWSKPKRRSRCGRVDCSAAINADYKSPPGLWQGEKYAPKPFSNLKSVTVPRGATNQADDTDEAD